jgi:hypothetical protein
MDQTMTQIVPLKTKSGQIHRFRLTGDFSDLPAWPGIYCFTPPQMYPGGPIEPVYWGKAVADFSTEVLHDTVRHDAAKRGATHVATLIVEGRIARKRIFEDLAASFPPSITAPVTSVRRPSVAPGYSAALDHGPSDPGGRASRAVKAKHNKDSRTTV